MRQSFYHHTLLGGASALILVFPFNALAQTKACVRDGASPYMLTGSVAAANSFSTCTASDNWSRVVPLLMTKTTTTGPNGAAEGMISFTATSGHLYFGFTVGKDGDLSTNDKILLAFDRNNNNAWENGDFVLGLEVTTSTPETLPPDKNPMTAAAGGTTDCRKDLRVTYYSRTGAVFAPQDLPSGVTITAKIAWDYSTSDGDGEQDLWNVEVDINNPSGLGIVLSNFAMGAYVYVALGGQNITGVVLQWPSSLPPKGVGDANLNSLNPSTLAEMSVGGSCFNVTFNPAKVPHPWQINGSDVAAGNNGVLNPANQVNRFRVTFFYQGPGFDLDPMQQDAAPNGGDVDLELIPSNSTGWSPQASWHAPTVHLTGADVPKSNGLYSAQFTLPAGTFGSNIYFFCAFPKLTSFARDDNPAMVDNENQLHINHNWFHTSVDTQTVDLRADGIPGLGSGQSGKIVLFINNTNDPASRSISAQDGSEQPLRASATVGALLLLGGIAARRRRHLAALLGVVGVALVGYGCHLFFPGQPTIETKRWQVLNTKELGIKPIPKQPGWFEVPIQQGEVKHMKIAFQDQPLPYETVTHKLGFRADSATGTFQRVRVPVRAGQVATVLTFGEIDPDGPGVLPSTSAAGLIRNDSLDISLEPVTRGRLYLLNNPQYVPSQWVGTVLGSFDGFATSFVIGTHASVAVPRGAEYLSVAINGTASDYKNGTGSLNLNVMVTEGPKVPTFYPIPTDLSFDFPFFIQGWRVLTSTNLYTFYEKPITEPNARSSTMARVPLGEAHLSIYKSQ